MKCLVVTVLAVFVGCGGGDDDAPAVDAAPVVIDADNGPCTSAGGPGGTHKLYLNFESQDLTPGANDATQNITAMITVPGTSAPWYEGNVNADVSITRITDNVTAILAPFDIEVTTTRPAAGPYTMMVMGGVSGDLGFPMIGSLAASAGCNPMENVIHLVFNQDINSATSTVISAYGIGKGLSTVELNGSCMCWNDPMCQPITDVCTIGDEANIDMDGSACMTGATTTDVHDNFKQAFGCRP